MPKSGHLKDPIRLGEIYFNPLISYCYVVHTAKLERPAPRVPRTAFKGTGGMLSAGSSTQPISPNSTVCRHHTAATNRENTCAYMEHQP